MIVAAPFACVAPSESLLIFLLKCTKLRKQELGALFCRHTKVHKSPKIGEWCTLERHALETGHGCKTTLAGFSSFLSGRMTECRRRGIISGMKSKGVTDQDVVPEVWKFESWKVGKFKVEELRVEELRVEELTHPLTTHPLLHSPTQNLQTLKPSNFPTVSLIRDERSRRGARPDAPEGMHRSPLRWTAARPCGRRIVPPEANRRSPLRPTDAPPYALPHGFRHTSHPPFACARHEVDIHQQ